MPIGSWCWKACWLGGTLIVAEFDAQAAETAPDPIEIDVRSVDELYAMYMPFISGGGLFVNGHRLGGLVCELGSELTLALRLSADDEQQQVSGRVIWLTPASRKGGTSGVGIQLLDNGEMQGRIERLLTGMLSSQRPTLTL